MIPYQEFSGFKYTHVPSAFLKSTFEEVWKREGEVLDAGTVFAVYLTLISI